MTKILISVTFQITLNKAVSNFKTLHLENNALLKETFAETGDIDVANMRKEQPCRIKAMVNIELYTSRSKCK